MAKKFLYNGKSFVVDRVGMRTGSKVLVFWRGYKRPTWEPLQNLRHTAAYKRYESVEIAHFLAGLAEGPSGGCNERPVVLDPPLTSVEARVRFVDQAGIQQNTNVFIDAAEWTVPTAWPAN